jgi:hypothetical protein
LPKNVSIPAGVGLPRKIRSNLMVDLKRSQEKKKRFQAKHLTSPINSNHTHFATLALVKANVSTVWHASEKMSRAHHGSLKYANLLAATCRLTTTQQPKRARATKRVLGVSKGETRLLF